MLPAALGLATNDGCTCSKVPAEVVLAMARDATSGVGTTSGGGNGSGGGL